MKTPIYVLGTSPGSYGDQTRHQILPDSTANFIETNAGIVEAVIQHNGIGIVPVSNPYGGSVMESWTALEKHRENLIIAGSHILPLDHAVIQRIQDTGNTVQRIISHPQAYYQSKPALDEAYPGHAFVESTSTIGALGMIENEHDVAICSAEAIRGNQELSRNYQVIREKISPSDNATKFVVITTANIQEIMHLPPSEIDVVRITLSDKPLQLAIKTGLIGLLGSNIHEWDRVKTLPGVSPLYTALLITSRLPRNFLANALLRRARIQPISQKEDFIG